MERRNFLKYGLVATGGLLVARPFCAFAGAEAATEERSTAASMRVAATPLSGDEAAARLAALRARPRAIDPVSARLFQAARRIPHSVLVYDLDQVEENYLAFLEAFPGVNVHYAIKCCPNPRVLERLARVGCGFDFASRGELDMAVAVGAPMQDCIFSNTVKRLDDIEYAWKKGVRTFVADAEGQVRAQAQKAPGSNLCVRLLCDNKDAAHPLGEKFGCTVEHALELLRLGKQLGLEPYGTHFHVGTQCYSAKAYAKSSRECAHIFKKMLEEGVRLQLLDIGGGFPVQYLGRKVPALSEIHQQVQAVLHRELPDHPVTLAAEPGRAIAGTAAAMSSRVLLRTTRPSGEWLHLDVGVYQGLDEALDGIVFPISYQASKPGEQAFTLCGPTCDSVDMISRGQQLSSEIASGDLLVLSRTGAYSEGLATHFNAIDPPEVRYLDELFENRAAFQVRGAPAAGALRRRSAS